MLEQPQDLETPQQPDTTTLQQPAAQPQAQPDQNVAQQPLQPHHNALAGVLAAIAGPNVSYHVDPQTQKMVSVATPPAPGDAFKKILAGALIGMAGGAAQPNPRAGFAGGVGAGAAASTGAFLRQDENARAQANADYIRQANTALQNQHIAESTWRMTREQDEIDQKAADQLNSLHQMIADGEGSKDLGHFASFAEFAQNYQKTDPDILKKQAQGMIRAVPTFEGGKPTGVQLFEVHPSWLNSKTTEPVTVSIPSGVDDKGKAVWKDHVIPAGGMSNGDVIRLETQLGINEMKRSGAEKQSEMDKRIADYVAGHKLPDTPESRTKAYEALKSEPQITVNTAKAESAASEAAKKDEAKISNSTRTMIESAPRVLDFVDRINGLVDQQTKTLGPAASRWQEFMAGKVGAPNPEFTKLRTDVGLLTTLLMRMHVGARGGEYIMKHFQDLIDTGKQSPENLKAALGEIRQYAQDVAGEAKTGVTPAGHSQPATGTPVYVNGQLVGHTTDGKTMIPAGQK